MSFDLVRSVDAVKNEKVGARSTGEATSAAAYFIATPAIAFLAGCGTAPIIATARACGIAAGLTACAATLVCSATTRGIQRLIDEDARITDWKAAIIAFPAGTARHVTAAIRTGGDVQTAAFGGREILAIQDGGINGSKEDAKDDTQGTENGQQQVSSLWRDSARGEEFAPRILSKIGPRTINRWRRMDGFFNLDLGWRIGWSSVTHWRIGWGSIFLWRRT